MSARRDNLIVGLDIGTTKICAIVGNLTEEGIEIVGIGTSPSSGLRKGVVINIESTVASIKKAERLLGYNPSYNIKQGMAEAVRWYKANL